MALRTLEGMLESTHRTCRLPEKDRAYSLDEILKIAGGDMEFQYNQSYRFALATQALQKAVQQAVASGNAQWLLAETDDGMSQSLKDYKAVHQQRTARELTRDLSVEKTRLFRQEPTPSMPILRKAASDPLLMARKHMVDLLAPNPKNHDRRGDAAEAVTRLMMLMADNACRSAARDAGAAAIV